VREATITGRVRKQLSEKWIGDAFPITTPSPFRDAVVCNDDCDHCTLVVGEANTNGKLPRGGGCAKRCVRWGDPSFVCNSCPCLASLYVPKLPRTVDESRQRREAPPLPRIIELRNRRRAEKEGMIE
jgi:hypothetical protein